MSLIATGLSLFAVATVAGAINSVAGGGSFLSFPTLMLAGLPGISANATNNTAMWIGTVASAHGYREEVKQTGAVAWRMIFSSAAGSIVGALLVLLTPETAFVKAVPFLLLAATLLFILGPLLTRRHGPQPDIVELPRWALPAQFLLGIYGGYFGAGVGIATLALLAQMGFTKIHQMNGLKTLLTACMNGVAVVPFALAGAIVWHWALVMCAGAMIGGYVGARLARKASPALVRRMVIVIAVSMTTYFFWKTYG
ncbi:putative membrane protein YfcA [Actimicrobium sp. GrIS 1.19]|uniref:sulfite exporter TauE/SafE family protein n=1 Tax=Actimicrobium sp. GrIS 1.19 TaxID=3071708 RepID=UPI002E04A127|nr:putative membrane protein YfcA [Actimicrobium sp. GrIS 1.19]